MAEKRDYYEVLGVTKGASDDEIKKAYRKMAKENHPDLHPGDKACEERFKEVNEAYEILSDPDKKARYDQYGHAAFDPSAGFGGGGAGGFGDFGDIFSDIFGGGFGGFGDIFGGGGGRASNAPRKGESIRTNVSISFEEAAFGCKKDVTVARIEVCPDCKGTGCAPGTTPEICPDCKGTGSVRTTQRTPFGMVQSSGPCQRCRGTGKIIHQPCPTCHGMGNVRKQHKLNVTIPAGIDDGQTVSVRGQGNAGSNGGPAGDLLVFIIVRPHARFERDGANVVMEQEISYAQAVLGADIEVPTLDGSVKLNIPEGTQAGSVFRMKGKGIPLLRGSGRGDQYVTVKVAVPKNLTASQKELLREFAASVGDEVSDGHGGIFGKKKR
ncbi:MAG TPA: molecular chaperone DnaJ [Oscillospiraceae bacterium]|nr:molecular chaperone DnaJ [Oscillospiraceae bacterium]HPS76491.1 molecular chaperone DnaJ [Oscillospiraceae bacterium]